MSFCYALVRRCNSAMIFAGSETITICRTTSFSGRCWPGGRIPSPTPAGGSVRPAIAEQRSYCPHGDDCGRKSSEQVAGTDSPISDRHAYGRREHANRPEQKRYRNNANDVIHAPHSNRQDGAGHSATQTRYSAEVVAKICNYFGILSPTPAGGSGGGIGATATR
jgi:hypothetical protein